MKICLIWTALAKDATDCTEDKCAWYDGKQCAVVSIVKALERIAEGMRK